MRRIILWLIMFTWIMVFGILNGQSLIEFNDFSNLAKQAELRMTMLGSSAGSINQTEATISPGDVILFKKSGLGVLMSAAIPGTGEMYAGSWIKGGIILGVEVALWMGYVKFWDDGKDLTVEYEAYADQYWSKKEYKRNIQTGDPSTHTLPETKTQQYYEMIGKYHQFKRGWYDWEDGKPDMTPMRTDYMDMRENSNIAFRKAFYFSMVSLANHVFSAFDAAWTIRNVNRKIETGVRMGLDRFDRMWIPHCTVSVAW